MVAVYASDLDTARLALECGANPNCSVDGKTSLRQAVGQADSQMVRLLLDFQADPNLGFPINWTFDMEILQLLLEAGASLEPNREGSIMHNAVGNLDLLKFLVERAQGQPFLEWFDQDFGDTLLGSAARNGATQSVAYLLDLGSDPNRCDPDRIARTPLATAAATNPEVVKLLLDAGADPDHSWGLCASGRKALTFSGCSLMRELLREADQHPEHRRRVRAESRPALAPRRKCVRRRTHSRDEI